MNPKFRPPGKLLGMKVKSGAGVDHQPYFRRWAVSKTLRSAPVGGRHSVPEGSDEEMQETVDHVRFVAVPHGSDEQRPNIHQGGGGLSMRNGSDRKNRRGQARNMKGNTQRNTKGVRTT